MLNSIQLPLPPQQSKSESPAMISNRRKGSFPTPSIFPRLPRSFSSVIGQKSPNSSHWPLKTPNHAHSFAENSSILGGTASSLTSAGIASKAKADDKPGGEGAAWNGFLNNADGFLELATRSGPADEKVFYLFLFHAFKICILPENKQCNTCYPH